MARSTQRKTVGGRKSRCIRSLNLMRAPKKPRFLTKISRLKMMRAIPGSGGLISEIARRLGCCSETVRRYLDRPGWEEVKKVYYEECERIADEAESAIQFAISQRLDLRIATENARWYLSRKHRDRGYGDEQKVRLEGGRDPILVRSTDVRVEDLNLPIEVRRQILEAIEKPPEGSVPSEGDSKDDDSE